MYKSTNINYMKRRPPDRIAMYDSTRQLLIVFLSNYMYIVYNKGYLFGLSSSTAAPSPKYAHRNSKEPYELQGALETRLVPHTVYSTFFLLSLPARSSPKIKVWREPLVLRLLRMGVLVLLGPMVRMIVGGRSRVLLGSARVRRIFPSVGCAGARTRSGWWCTWMVCMA